MVGTISFRTALAIACALATAPPDAINGVFASRRLHPNQLELHAVNVYADNPMWPVDVRAPDGVAFAPIGVLESTHDVTFGGRTGSSAGTGFLVSPCYVLTAAHVVFGDNQSPNVDGDYTMDFHIGKLADGSFAASVPAIPDMQLMSYTGTTDWILLKLDDHKCFGVHPKVGWFEKAKGKIHKFQSVFAIGYAATYMSENAAKQITATLAISYGVVKGVAANGMYRVNTSFEHGSSGGPVFTIENNRILLIGLITAASDPRGTSRYEHYDDVQSNKVQDIDQILTDPKVQATLEWDKARFGTINPGAERQTRSLPKPPLGILPKEPLDKD